MAPRPQHHSTACTFRPFSTRGSQVMAMDVGGTKGGVKSDINVTPLVDVMLVLLIIMMLIAPMLQQGVPVVLPTAENTVDKPETQEQTVVAIDAKNQFYVDGIQVARNAMADRV